jgi:hypothetical protein
MRSTIARFLFPMSILATVAIPAPRASARPAPPQTPVQVRKPAPVDGQPALELRISGPKIIHRGDHVEFKAVLINHSTVPVLVSPAERSHALVLATWWIATDASGAMLDYESIGYCPVNGLDYSHKWRLTDSSIRLLQPGESAEVPVTFPDPRDPLKFRKKGTYHLTLNYYFNPPGREADTKDGKLVLKNYETDALSAANVKALREASGFSLVSEPFTIVLQ